ncbi:MAG: hypothetical protein MAG431_00398 [Chloroflexi bacterium]|nr:hypothetical protein [Chloroflexota bacterium]
MKIEYSKKRKKLKLPNSSAWGFYGLVLALMLGAFLAGMFFYRNGYASVLLKKIRHILQQEPVAQAVGEVSEEIKSEIKLYQANGLTNIFLDIPFDSMMAIEEKREKALEVGVLHSSDEDYVPATLRQNGEQTLDIKLRLKGDWVDHLRSDKWSFRIHITEDDGALLGMRRFSLQSPHTRSFASEWGFHQNLFMEGILAPRYSFVNIIINGEYKGIYALEESFTGDLLESQGKREGIIFRINEDLLWLDWTNFLDVEHHEDSDIGRFWRVNNPTANEIVPYRSNRIARSEVLSEQLIAAKELLYSFNHGLLAADQVFDEELWGRYFAITDLWAGGHGTDWINNKFYYNPVTGLIEPIAFDGFVFHPSFTADQLAFPFSESPFFDSPGVQRAYVETLERIASPEYIEMLEEKFGEELEDYYHLLVKEYQDEDYEEYRRFEGPPILLPWEELENRAELLSRNLNPAQPIRGNYQIVEQEGKPYLRLDLVNLMILPVQIREITLGDNELEFEKTWCSTQSCQEKIIKPAEEAVLLSGDSENFASASFYLPLESIDHGLISEENLSLSASLYGGSKTFAISLSSSYSPQGLESGIKPSSALDEALEAHPYLELREESQVAISPGDWEVVGDLILPEGYNLFIPEGTTLRLEEGSVILSYGKVEIQGTKEHPVLLTAQGESWGGMVVLGAAETSHWRHAKVEKMAGIPYPGWVLTGGITFYQSAVEISSSVIGNNTTEDALNVIQADLSMENVEFTNTSSDAFDGDFVSGTVTGCTFHNIRGDAFDASGSQVLVTDSRFANIGDKAISVGEESEVTLENLSIRDVNIGIASKDLSTLVADSIIIDNAKIAALAAYVKKPQYGPATLEATNVEILNTETPALCQTGSQLLLNGESIPPEDIDVDALYEQGVLGN